MHQPHTDLSKATARLHLSESPFALPDTALAAATAELESAQLYPEPGSPTAVAALAGHWSTSPDSVVITNGCDEAILYIYLRFGQGRTALLAANSYTGYKELAWLANQTIAEIPLAGWQPDISAFLDRIDSRASVAILSNPHNPTGNVLSPSELHRFVSGCNERGIIPVIDEAYLDFADPAASMMAAIVQYERLIILRSFAKSHGLAGIRVGAAVGTPSLISELRDACNANPFSVNRLAQRLVLQLVKDNAPFIQNRDAVVAAREHLQTELSRLGIWFIKSAANFVFMKAPPSVDAAGFYSRTGVFVRDCASYGLDGYWRVSCGTEAQMATLIDGLRHAIVSAEQRVPG